MVWANRKAEIRLKREALLARIQGKVRAEVRKMVWAASISIGVMVAIHMVVYNMAVPLGS